MKDTILSARGKPFKLARHCENAIKNKPGYVVVEKDGGFVGVREIPLVESIKDLSGRDIFCPSCGLSFLTTTKAYDPNENANPAMIDLKPLYKSYGWDELPKDSSMGYGCIYCPECESAMCPDGKLRIDAN